MKNISKILCLLVLGVLFYSTSSAQDSRAYDYKTDKNGNLNKDANGNPVDFSSVASVITAGSANVNTSIYNLPFDVVFLGKVYKSFLIGTSGYIALGNTNDAGQPFQFPNNAGNSFKLGNNTYRFQGVIAPFWDIQLANSIKYTVTGTAPNRALVVEWKTTIPNISAKTGYESNYQARIYETTGVVEFVYGRMVVPAGNATAVNATIGIAKNSALLDNNFLAIADLDSFKAVRTLTAYTTAVDNLINKADTGIIPGLNYTNDSVARRFVFTPDVVNTPSNLRTISISFDDAVLYWNDNSTNEVGFELWKKDRFGNFNYFDSTTAGVNFYLVKNLFPGETHVFRVRATGQGKYSAFSNTYTVNIPAPQLVEAKASGNWSDSATWSNGTVPSRYDSVIISNGYAITLDLNDAQAFELIVDSGSLVYEQSALPRRLSVFRNIEIHKNGKIVAPASSIYTNTAMGLDIRGNLTNKGVLDLYTSGSGGTYPMGVDLSFIGSNVSFFTSDAGTTTDLSTFSCERNASTDSIYFRPYSVTVRGYNDSLSGGGFIDATGWAGTLVFDGTCKLQTRFLAANAVTSETAGLWLNSDSLEIIPQNGNLTFNGTFRISKGKAAFGATDANFFNGSFDFIMEGGQLDIAGGLYSDNATSYTQTGGKIRVAVVGNSTTSSFTPSFGITGVNTTVKMLGGEIVIVRPGTWINTGRREYWVTGNVNTSVYGDTKVKITESTGMTGGREFYIMGHLPNLIVDTAANSPEVIKVTISNGNPTWIHGDFILSTNDSFATAGGIVSLYDSIVNNGTIYPGSFATQGGIVIAGNNQTLYGTGIMVNLPRFEMFQSDSNSTFTILRDSSILRTITLNLTQGKIINAKYFGLGDGARNIGMEIGRTGTRYPGGLMDSIPAVNQGTGTYALQYINLGKTFETGYEIPTSGRVNTLVINSDSAIKLNKRIDVLTTFLLTKGVFITDSINKIRVLNSAAAAITGGSATAYIKGPLSRKIAPNQASTSYTFPVGGNLYNPLNLSNIITNANLTEITAEFRNDSLNYTAGKGFSKIDSPFGYWVMKADSNAAGFTNYGLNLAYKLSNDNFARLAAGKTKTTNDAPVLDAIASKASILVNNFTVNGFKPDTANPVLFIAPGEYIADTIRNGDVFRVGQGKDLENLTAVANKLNSAYIDGNATFLITSSYDDANEVYPILFSQMRYVGDTNKKIEIRLDTNVFGVLTSSRAKVQNITYGMIGLYGADGIEFDGAGYDFLGNPSNTREWTFRTESNAANASLFMLQQDASNNIFNNLNMVSNTNATNQAAVNIASTFTGGKGNDNIIIRNCSLVTNTDRIASNGIYSAGLSAAATNDSIQIINNEISTFITAGISAAAWSGPGWEITGNHIFSSPTIITSSSGLAISIAADASAAGYDISYNYIGGSQKFAGGTSWQNSSTAASMLINVATTATPASVFKGNVIKNYFQQANTTNITRVMMVTRGNWVITGNKFGGTGNSVNDSLSFSANVAVGIVYINNNTLTNAEITDNEFSFINHHNLGQLNNKSLRMVEYYAPSPALIARNKFHDVGGQSFANAVTNAAFTGVYLSTTASNNIIEDNVVYGINYRTSNQIATLMGLCVNAGNGIIRNNKVSGLNYGGTTATTANSLMGINVQAGLWDVYNNQVYLKNELYPNSIVSLQGIRNASTSARSRFYHNTVLLGGQTRNTNSYAFFGASTTSRAELFNNILVANTIVTGGAFYPVVINVVPTTTIFNSDFNHVYSSNPTALYRHVTTGLILPIDSMRKFMGIEKNSVGGFIPKFRDSNNIDLLLTTDTINWKLNAAGTATTFTVDVEKDVRSSTQPDIGADEFVAPMFQQPVFTGGNDTLCAGNKRILTATNGNITGNIYWFNQPAGGDTLAIGDTYNTDSVKTNTTFYIQVSDSLLRSYRVAIPVRVLPAPTPVMLNLPTDSMCFNTSITLVTDSQPGTVISWYDSLTAPTPYYTGRTLNTGILSATKTYYAQATTGLGCVSAKAAYVVKVSSDSVVAPVLTPYTICAGDSVMWITNGPGTIKWYAKEMQSPVLKADTIFKTGKLITDTTFWFEAFNGNCRSERSSVTVKVNPIPVAPVISNQNTVCYGAGINLNPTVGGTLRWFTDSTTTTPLANGPLNFASITADTLLYLDNELAGCVSPRVYTLIKAQTPSAVSIASVPATICFNTGAQIVLSKTGPGTVSWFNTLAATTSIATGDTFNTGNLATGKTYYYEAFDGLCKGPRDSVSIIVIPFATKPAIAPVDSICFGTEDTLTATATGAVINWYDNKAGAPVALGSDFVIPALTGNKKYFAKAIYSGCESGFEEINVRVRALPQPPIVDTVSQVCRNTAAMLKAVTPATAEWFNNPFTTTPVFTGNTFKTQPLTTNTTFYVRSTDGKCQSTMRPVTVSLRNAPAAPVINNVDPFCWGDNVTISAGSNAVIRWYKNSTDSVHFRADSLLYIGKMFRDTAYYIESYDGYCTSSKVPYSVSIIRYMDGFSFSIPDSVNIATPVTLSATGNIDNLYGWNFGAGASTSSGTGTGPYSISWSTKGLKNVRLTVTKKAGNVTCDTVFTKTVKVYILSELLSAAQADNSSLLSVYPNPTSSAFTIAASGQNTLAGIHLYDITGKLVHSEAVNGKTTVSLPVYGFSRGIYLLRVSMENGQTAVQKVIVE